MIDTNPHTSPYLVITCANYIRHGSVTTKLAGVVIMPLSAITDPIILIIATIIKGVTRSYLYDRGMQREYARYLANVIVYIPGQIYDEVKCKAISTWNRFKSLF